MNNTAPRRFRSSAALAALSLSLASCSKPDEAPRREPVASAGAAPVVASAPSASAAREQEGALPTLVPEPFEPAKGLDLYPIEGALMVVSALRVGLIAGEKIEWVGEVPDTNQWLGGSQINAVHGVWPDGVDVLYSSNNGRASQPTIYPLTGPKGAAVTFAPGGGLGWYAGSARLGKTTLVGGYDFGGGYRIATTRGPGLVIKPISAVKAGCTAEEVQRQFAGLDTAIAVPFSVFTATDKGTLVTIGNLCDRPGSPVAEVWDQPGKSRIIDLEEWIKETGYFPDLLRGKGDELFLATNPVLRYEGGKFEPLPRLDKAVWNAFVSPAGKLHGISGRTIHRYDDGKWTPIAMLPYRMSFRAIAMDEQGTIWVAHDGVARLRPSNDAGVEGCKTPFVYLYDVSWKNEAKYTFPTTRKALSTFPGVADISLVEYWEGRRSLGIKVKTREQGEAVVAHVLANMKDEHPEVTCYVPRKNVRVIELK